MTSAIDRMTDDFGEGWVKIVKPAAELAADTTAFHLDGQHDQQSHGRRDGGTAEFDPAFFVDDDFDGWIDTADPYPMYERAGVDMTVMQAADFSEGEHPASWAHADYTLGGSEAMNSLLRGQELPPHFQSEHAENAEILTDAIATAAPTEHDIVVYRGVRGSSIGAELSGSRWTDAGFVSTSLDRRVAESFGDSVFEIHVPAGSQAIAGNWGEAEVILAPGSMFESNDWEDDSVIRLVK